MASEVREKAALAKEAAAVLASLGTEVKNKALLAMARALREREADILAANQKDLDLGQEKGLSKAMLERLMLNHERLEGMAQGLEDIAGLDDPIGKMTSVIKRPNGLMIGKRRVPLGVIGIIYESRPNVTVDAAALCLKSGNAVILRGGSEAINSNIMTAGIIAEAAEKAGIPAGSIQLVETTDRAAIQEMMKMHGLIDVLIPRGGAGLIRTVVTNSSIPVIETGIGNCHLYVDEYADLEMAVNIAHNGKTQRPAVCNALESILVHEKVAGEFLPLLAERLKGVELRGCERVRNILPQAELAAEEDFASEFLDLIVAVKVVSDINEAIKHIQKYGTGHSEAIITENYSNALLFTDQVDAAAVYVNASTRFTDGSVFGLGAEIGISTQKLHTRGPMGLDELTTNKFVIFGQGQIR